MEIASSTLLEELERLTLRLNTVVQDNFMNLSKEQYNWKTHPEKWSIVECFQHLNQTFGLYIPNMKKAIATAQAQTAAKWKAQTQFQSGWLGDFLVSYAKLDDNNKPAKTIAAPKVFRPILGSMDNPPRVIELFLQYQQELIALLEAAQHVNIQKARVPTAFGRWITIRLGDALRLVVYHNERHLVQALNVRLHEQFGKKI